MRRSATVAAVLIFLAGGAKASLPTPAEKTQRRELRESLQGDKHRLRQVGPEQHKVLVLIRDREKSDLAAVKASAARGEALHAAILEVHERRRRERLALRQQGREERERLRRAIKGARERIVALRQKK